jgi:Predicted cobalamin binding protein
MKPYGDKSNDGKIQLSFTFNCKREVLNSAIKELCQSMNLIDTNVVSISSNCDFHCVILYASTNFDINEEVLVEEKVKENLDREFILKQFTDKCNRTIRVLGATTGSDAHTVGLDSILNKKGFHGDYGLESYPCFSVYNMGAQVTPEALVTAIVEWEPDVICISQTVSQMNLHIECLKNVIQECNNQKVDLSKYILICGGMRVTNDLAISLGYDAGFTKGNTAIDVVNFIYEKLKVKNFVLQPLMQSVSLKVKVKEKELLHINPIEQRRK